VGGGAAGLARFRTEQPPYSILGRGIEREVLPICQKYGMGTLVWSPLAKGMLTGRYRKGQPLPDSARQEYFPGRCPTSATWMRSSS
jgi:aryl-alcohol dehydrogenase-like predicted oxidoreductase